MRLMKRLMKRLIYIFLSVIFTMPSMCQIAWAAPPIDGHLYEYIEEKSRLATCIEDGYLYYECINHSDVYYQEPVKATGHTLYTKSETAAGCTHSGLIIKACSNCDYTETTEFGEATGHRFTDKITRQAYCNHEGVKTFTCSLCGDTYEEVIPRLAHRYKTITSAATKVKDGKVEEVCSLCGDTVLIKTIEHTGASGRDTTKNANESFGKKNTVEEQVIKRVNETITMAMTLEVAVFVILIYRDMAVLRWYLSRKKVFFAKNSGREAQ